MSSNSLLCVVSSVVSPGLYYTVYNSRTPIAEVAVGVVVYVVRFARSMPCMGYFSNDSPFSVWDGMIIDILTPGFMLEWLL